MNLKHRYFAIIAIFLLISTFNIAGNIVIKNNPPDKLITFGNSKLMLTIDYNGKCTVTSLSVSGDW